MSRQNKVNPGQYTQRGRLTQDDAARELARQRSIGSQHTWQPVQKNMLPRLASTEDADRGGETSGDAESLETGLFREKTKPTARVPRKNGAKTAAPATATQPRTARTGAVRKTTGKAKTGKAAKPAMKTMPPSPTRKAVLARNVGGPALKPLRAAKRGRS